MNEKHPPPFPSGCFLFVSIYFAYSLQADHQMIGKLIFLSYKTTLERQVVVFPVVG